MTRQMRLCQSTRRAFPPQAPALQIPMPVYPPDRHILRDLRLSLLRTPGQSDRVPLPIVPELLHPGGTVALGALAVIVDVAAAGVAMRTIAPDWLATADLEIHALETSRVGVAVAQPTLLRQGKTTLVFDVLVRGYDSEDRIDLDPGQPVAFAMMTFVRIARPRATEELEHPAEPSAPERVDFALPTSGLSRPFLEELGLRTIDAANGRLQLPKSDFATNSFGSLQGGIVATLAQAAAETASRGRDGSERPARDLSVHYLAQGSGPWETVLRVLRRDEGEALARVEVRDLPSGNLMAVATTRC